MFIIQDMGVYLEKVKEILLSKANMEYKKMWSEMKIWNSDKRSHKFTSTLSLKTINPYRTSPPRENELSMLLTKFFTSWKLPFPLIFDDASTIKARSQRPEKNIVVVRRTSFIL